MEIYNFHPETGEYISCTNARPDPLIKDTWELPAHATFEPPMTAVQGFARCFIDGAWQLVEDNRGQIVYRRVDGEAFVVDTLGKIPDVFTKEAPPKPEPTYADKRRGEYPSIEEQLDMLYWDMVNGTSKWKDMRTSIKNKYPKE